MPDRLRRLWDFDDLDATEHRFREELGREPYEAGRAEVLTQLARIQALRGDFDGCEELLAQAEELAGASEIANVRIKLERGRKQRSAGEGAASVPLFESTFERALAAYERDATNPDAVVWAREAVETARQALGR